MLRKGFTLAEVLIALLLVGILSSISIQTLRNRDNSAEYEALRNKAVTNIQGVMHEALFTKKSSEIFDDNFETLWGEVNKRLSTDTGSIKSKDGAINITTSQIMRDGVNYAYTPKEGNSHVAEITIDVNGSKAPNEEGRDIYKYSMDKFGNILLATLPDAPDKEYCPDGVTVKNSDGSNCPKCTDGSMVTSPDRSNCPKCPNGTTERNADGSNCDKCANGTMANADRSNCPKCGIQTIEANATRSNCPKCPDGTTEKIDAAGSNCPVVNECKAPNVEINGCCMPKVECPSDETYMPNFNYCALISFSTDDVYAGPCYITNDEWFSPSEGRNCMLSFYSDAANNINYLETKWNDTENGEYFDNWYDREFHAAMNRVVSNLGNTNMVDKYYYPKQLFVELRKAANQKIEIINMNRKSQAIAKSTTCEK